MARHEFDKGSKYLIQKQTRGVLALGGATRIRSCRAIVAELVQPRQLPDGLVEVYFEGEKTPDHVLVEIATYPERRALEQALDDLTLARQYLQGKLPELLMIVLCQRGKFTIDGSNAVRSRLGWSELSCRWNVVEMGKVPAATLLAVQDAGIIPWVVLSKFDEPPAEMLELCRERIEKQAASAEKENLLAVAQVLAQLRFPEPDLLALLGGKDVMIESPLIEELLAEQCQELILTGLKSRFVKIPRNIRRLVTETKKNKKLRELVAFAYQCKDLEAFKERLLD